MKELPVAYGRWSQVLVGESVVWTEFLGTEMEVINSSESNINNTSNSSLGNETSHEIDLAYVIPVGILIALMMCATAIGNAMVVTAVVKERQLRSLANHIVASLAFTDMLVSVLVMPLSATALLSGHWPLGPVMCDIYTTLDIMCCTSSILHLVAIAVDRYWTVTNITYTRGNKRHRYFLPVMITSSWVLSAAISLAPVFGWREEQKEGACMISQNQGFTIYSTGTAFWIPLLFIIAIYTKIFLVVRARVRKKNFKDAACKQWKREAPSNMHIEQQQELMCKSDTMGTIGENDKLGNGIKSNALSPMSPTSNITATTELNKELESEESTEGTSTADSGHVQIHNNVTTNGSHNNITTNGSHNNITTNGSRATSVQRLLKRALTKSEKSSSSVSRKKIAKKKERKAIRTLLIITGIFITCWLPFFVLATMTPFAPEYCEKHIPKILYDIFNWLGYCNSMLNPIIYTIFSPDFRTAFRKILFGHYKFRQGKK